MSKVQYYGQIGRYDYCHPSAKQYCLHLRTPSGNVSELWAEDEMPNLEDFLPSDVLNLIEERLDHYMYKSSRDEEKKKIQAIREHIKEYDIEWASDYLQAAEREVSRRAAILVSLKEQS